MTDRSCLVCGFVGKTTWKRGLCNRCYCKAYKAGTVDLIANPSNGTVAVFGAKGENNARWTGGEAGYNAIHKRLTAQRGRAADNPCAENCNAQAEHWSYDGYCPAEKFDANRRCPYCPHIEHYQPRCRPCHSRWDADQVVVAASVLAPTGAP